MNFREIIKIGIQKLSQEEQEAFLKEIIEAWPPERQGGFFVGRAQQPKEVKALKTIHDWIFEVLADATTWLSTEALCALVVKKSAYQASSVRRTLQRLFDADELQRVPSLSGRGFIYARKENPPLFPTAPPPKPPTKALVSEEAILKYISVDRGWVPSHEILVLPGVSLAKSGVNSILQKLVKAKKLKRAQFGRENCLGLIYANTNSPAAPPVGFTLVNEEDV